MELSRRYFYPVMTATALGIGALQMFHVRAGFLTDYGADIFGTAWLYGMFRQGRTVLSRRPMPGAATAWFVFAGCAVSEIAQRYHMIPGRYDPLDLAAFASSVAACYALDRVVDLGAST